MFGGHRWSSWALDRQCCRLVVVPTRLWHEDQGRSPVVGDGDFRAESVHPPSSGLRASEHPYTTMPIFNRLTTPDFIRRLLHARRLPCCPFWLRFDKRHLDQPHIVGFFPFTSHLRSDFRNSFIDSTMPPQHLRHRLFGVFV